MKNEEVNELIEFAIKKSSENYSGALICERGVWFAIREAFNRGFERGSKNFKRKFIERAKVYFDDDNMYVVNQIIEDIHE